MPNVTRFPLKTIATAVLLLAAATACTTVGDTILGEKVDYGSAQSKPTPLDVPPDLTQLAVDPRYTPQAGTISAAAMQMPGAAASAPVTNMVAPDTLGNVQIMRDGRLRFLRTPLTPEQLWPQLESLWKEAGLTLALDQPEIGLMETEWAENRAKLSNDIIRKTLGKVFDALFSTGELDKYRTRVERNELGGSDVYIAQRGLEEVYTDTFKDHTTWRVRPNDPVLENVMLSRLLVKLGAKQEAAKAAVAQSASAPAAATRARVLDGLAAATLQVDESFDRAWRLVGLSLDRSGFTVEDRDRAQGVYFVRYVDPAQAGKEEPGFFSRMFKGDAGKLSGPVRYRVRVRGEGASSTVEVLNTTGGPENGDAGKRIVKLLFDDLK